ncbi:ketopantoate reductase family protein [Paraburkholderia sp. BL18I3N2]|uniref:ketopantoate reductase family protein n=1 Tax=Paraburkholderia sp. BL18I3N2 TaxID=1938799 RepID=UPI000D075190|nr:2-dehydropantoate 2-reductase N-terminal domain-containing protein [Paraburkholderia sp. BL18I3N2]
MALGAVGSYFGAAFALAGHDVTFCVRDTSRSEIETAGIRLTGPRGDFLVERVRHTSQPAHCSRRLSDTCRSHACKAMLDSLRDICRRNHNDRRG